MIRAAFAPLAALALGALSLGACAPGEQAGNAGEGYVDYPPLGERDFAEITPTLFVTNKRGNSLSVIDLESGEETSRVPTCANPHELALSPKGNMLAVACYGGTSVDVFATDSLERLASVDLGTNARPHGIVWAESGVIYATAEGRQSIFRITSGEDGKPELTEFPTGQRGSHMLAVAPDGSAAWTTDLGSRTVTRIDLSGGAAPVSVTVGEEPEGISLAPDHNALWVSARGSNQAFELDPTTMEVRKTVDTGRFPLRLLVRPQDDVAITSDLADGGLTVIDLASGEVVRSIAVSSPEEAEERFQVTILWSDDGSRIYVAETASDTIAEVDYASGEVLRRLPTGDGGDGMAIFDPVEDFFGN
ncbi:YncE family protein [uncultured Erythrobacter sp.]|uniref:Vgb family protein n=1 Tax=uncultured Erythrobacter sp. TaxID=263913 RepID=UPI002627B8AB|nr:YncE family protein [uncultured Erythrobacter sp.]